MDKVVYLASNGFAARMARNMIASNGHGELFGLLTGKQSIVQDDRVIVRGRRVDSYLRKYSILLFTDIKDNYTYKCNTIRQSGYIYYRVTLIFNILFSKLFRLIKLHRIRDVLLYDKELKKVIENLDFHTLVLFYPASICDQRVLYNARNTKKKVIIQIQSWDNLLTKGYFYVKADEYHVWGNIMRNELMEVYSINPGLINNVGVPHFNKKNNCHPKKNLILFTMSSMFIAPGEIDIVRKLAYWLQVKYPTWNLVVRLHPQNLEGPYKSEQIEVTLRRLEKIIPNLGISLPILNDSDVLWDFSAEDSIVLDQLLSNAKIVINSGSTITIEGLLRSCFVLHTFFDGDKEVPFFKSATRISNYPHFKKMHAYGAYWNSYNYDELLELVEDIICGELVLPEKAINKLLKEQINL